MRTFARTPITAPTAAIAQAVSALPPSSGRRRAAPLKRSSHPAFTFARVPTHPSAPRDDIQRLAREGIAGRAGPLPHLARIQRYFGPAHDLARVLAHVAS